MRDHERFLIRNSLRHLACLQEENEEMDAEILRRMQATPFREAFLLLQTIPGIGQLAAASILTETGTDLSTFPTAEKMASWAGTLPRKSREHRNKKGDPDHNGQPLLTLHPSPVCLGCHQETWLDIPVEISRNRTQTLPEAPSQLCPQSWHHPYTGVRSLRLWKEGIIRMNPPAGGLTSNGNAEIGWQLRSWWVQPRKDRRKLCKRTCQPVYGILLKSLKVILPGLSNSMRNR